MRFYLVALAIFGILAITWNSVTSASKETAQQSQNRTCSAEIAYSKYGSCPPPNNNIRCIWCNDNCRSDKECPDQKKCCPQPGCGNGCTDPL